MFILVRGLRDYHHTAVAETVQHLLRERLGSSGPEVKYGDHVWTWAQYLDEASGQAAAVIALADRDRPVHITCPILA